MIPGDKNKPIENQTNNDSDDVKELNLNSIIKDINTNYSHIFKRNIAPQKRNINKSNLQISHDKNFISHKRHIKSKSLTIQLSDKIAKEALIIELRRELNYHIKFQKIYKNYLSKIIHIKNSVKENKEHLQAKTNNFKDKYFSKYNIISNYEKSIVKLKQDKKDIININSELLQMKEKEQKSLQEDINKIQDSNKSQSTKIEELTKKIKILENKRDHILEELEMEFQKEKDNYKKTLKEYEILKAKFRYYTDIYNSYSKTGQEVAKQDVKLFDSSSIKNTIIVENLDLKLNESLMKKKKLKNALDEIKKKIKPFEEKARKRKEFEEREKIFKKKINKNKKGRNSNHSIKMRNTISSKISTNSSLKRLTNSISVVSKKK